MSESVVQELGLDLDELRGAIQAEYEAVAMSPEQGFHFHTGRPLTRLVGYHDEWLAGISETAIESFAGTGNPFAVDELRPGEWVVDVGCGAGMDSLIAARMVGPTGRVVGVQYGNGMLVAVAVGAEVGVPVAAGSRVAVGVRSGCAMAVEVGCR